MMVLAIIVNASSTFVEFFADVSMNGIDNVSANSYGPEPSVRTEPGHSQIYRDRTDLCDRVLDDLLLDEVGLVPDDELLDVLGRVPLDLLQPALDVRERLCRAPSAEDR